MGVAFVAGTFIFTDTLDRSFTAIFASAVGDVNVNRVGGVTADGSPTDKAVPASVVDQLSRVDGAARADGNVSAVGVYVVGANGKLVGGLGAPALAGNVTDAPAAHGLQGLTLLEGSEPTGPGEVAVDRTTVDKAGYQIGDEITLATTLPENPVMHVTLVGIIGYEQGGSLNGASFVAFDTKTAQDLFLGGQDAFNTVWVAAADGVSQEQLKANVQRALPSGFEIETGDEQADRIGGQIKQATGFLQTFLLVFAVISLVVGVFLIVNTFLMLVAQRTREMGLMRALGASKLQVSGSVVVEAAALGLVGGLLGIAAGLGLAKAIMFLFGLFGLDITSQPVVITISTVVYSLAAGVVTTVVGAAIPAWKASRVSPLAAMRDEMAVTRTPAHVLTYLGGGLFLAGVVSLVVGLELVGSGQVWWVTGGIGGVLLGVVLLSVVLTGPFSALFGHAYRRMFGAVGGIAAENARRNPARTAITASALMIGLTLVTTIATLGASAKASIADELSSSFAGDLVVSNITGQSFSTSVGDIAQDIDGVQAVSRLRFGFISAPGQQSTILPAIDPATFDSVVQTTFTQGAISDLAEGTVAISSAYAEAHQLAVGDSLSLDVPSGTREFPITGVYERNVLANSDWVVSLDTLAALGFPPADNILYVLVAPGVDTAVVQKQLEDRTSDLPMVTIKDQAGYVAEQQGLFDALLNLVYGLLGLAIVIAILGIVNTLALSVIERTREIGLLRAIGLDRRQLRRAIRWESVLISVYGAVLGTVMGVGFGVALIASLGGQGLSVLVVPWAQVIVFVLAAGLVGVFAAHFPARRASRFDVIRAITTE
jgi:putative ABC transport system permease protein